MKKIIFGFVFMLAGPVWAQSFESVEESIEGQVGSLKFEFNYIAEQSEFYIFEGSYTCLDEEIVEESYVFTKTQHNYKFQSFKCENKQYDFWVTRTLAFEEHRKGFQFQIQLNVDGNQVGSPQPLFSYIE